MIYRSIQFIVPLSLLALVLGCTDSKIPPSVTPNEAEVAAIRKKLEVAGGGKKKEEEQIAFSNEFATLTGTIKLSGAAPTNPTLNINKDMDVCKPGGATVTDNIVVAGAGGGLANVLLYATVPKDWCHESQVGSTETREFDQKNCLFINRIFPMQTTEKLKVLNSDVVGHNADLKPARNPKANPNIQGGDSYMYPPGDKELRQEKAPFAVNCSAHPWMQSYIIFRENGYFAVTGEDGKFAIENLPAGVPVTVTVWHEATRGVPGKEVAVQPEGIAKGWNKRGTFTVNLEPNSQADLQIAVNSSALSK